MKRGLTGCDHEVESINGYGCPEHNNAVGEDKRNG